MFKVLFYHYHQTYSEQVFYSVFDKLGKLMNCFLPSVCLIKKWLNGNVPPKGCANSAQLNDIQNVIDLIKEGVILLNNEGQILSINSFVESLWESKKHNIIGKHIHSLIDPNELSSFQKSWEERDNPPQFLRIKSKKQLNIAFDTEMVLQKTKVGNVSYYMLNIRDISTQIKVENALKEKKSELDMLIYKISHDLRGPLTSIFGLIDLANMPNICVKDAQKYIDLINKSAGKLDATIKDLIFFNEISSRPTFYSLFSIPDVAQQAIQEVMDTEDCNMVNFNLSVKNKSELNICSDITLLRNILVNLMGNSVKYKKENSDVSINISLLKTPNNVEIEVCDNGEGIEKEVQSKVFNMFYRGNKKSDGSGLGLFLVKQSVEKLNGEIYLQSKLHEGSCFKIVLPLADKC